MSVTILFIIRINVERSKMPRHMVTDPRDVVYVWGLLLSNHKSVLDIVLKWRSIQIKQDTKFLKGE